MDNLCHTLVGAACGEAGLKRATPLATATLIIAANLPDVDVLVFATDVPSVAFRRGWTHGVLAQAFLPLLLAAVIAALGRGRGARFGPLVLLSYVGVLSHVGLDWLNNYGVRLLMPFTGRWFYGDAVFIVDVWLWLALGLGVWLARRAASARPARIALVAASVYIAMMVASSRITRAEVLERWRAEFGGEPRALMVGPVPITPFRRAVIVDAGDHYVTGTLTFPGSVEFDRQVIPKHDDDPAVIQARTDDFRVQAVLVWARFPYFQVTRDASGAAVTVRDVRFGERVGGVTARVAAE